MAETLTPWFAFIVAMLATWRVSHLLTSEDGPADVIFHLRKYLANSFFGRLMDLFWLREPLGRGAVRVFRRFAPLRPHSRLARPLRRGDAHRAS